MAQGTRKWTGDAIFCCFFLGGMGGTMFCSGKHYHLLFRWTWYINKCLLVLLCKSSFQPVLSTHSKAIDEVIKEYIFSQVSLSLSLSLCGLLLLPDSNCLVVGDEVFNCVRLCQLFLFSNIIVIRAVFVYYLLLNAFCFSGGMAAHTAPNML